PQNVCFLIKKAMRSIYIIILLNLLPYSTLSAQGVDRDSIWIQDIISNGGEYQLRPEVIEAIRNGTLLNIGAPVSEPRLSSSGLPVSKDFDIIGARDNMFDGLHILHLPSYGGMLYQYEPDSLLIIHSALLQDEENILVREYFRIPHTSIEITAPGADLLLPDPEVIRGEWYGNLRARTFITVDAEEGLEEIFDPVERNKVRNRKNANAWKYYNMQEMDE
ncbi:MAG: hypothetical protein LIP01_01975, partial [Tannerellaceae bacterium]|nr:hypothetical protein [Tannerellaceae bacterium]